MKLAKIRTIFLFGLLALVACSHRHAVDSRPDLVRPFSGTIDLPMGPGEEVWGEKCRIHQPCEAIAPLPSCPGDIPLATFPLPANTTEEIVLNIPGRLMLEKGIESTVKACAPCCNSTSKSAGLAAEDGWAYALPNIGCFGDESRLCCNVIAVGQQVVARGLVRMENNGNGQRAYFKGDVTLCVL